MTRFRLRTRPSQKAPRGVALLDWLGDAPAIQVREELTAGLLPPPAAVDLLRIAGAVYCADKLAPRPGTWTRALELDFPVRDIDAWKSVVPSLADTLSFLSGDVWTLRPLPSSEAAEEPKPADDPVEAVCLFSGGLDSFAGAIDLLADGATVCLVAHHETGQAPKVQQRLAQRLATIYGTDRVGFRRVFLRPAPPSTLQRRQLPADRERSTRARSLLFLAAGLTVASGYGPTVPLVMPENGFIGINVPLTRARTGSLSTRTTHPHFMARFVECVAGLGITNPIRNPFRTATKGEVLAASRDPTTLLNHARETLSCAHPEAARYAERSQGNCGYCFPCLIRRAALHSIGLDNPSDYAFDALTEDGKMAQKRGADLRALIRSLHGPTRPIEVLRNGPVGPNDVAAFTDVFNRGRAEILAWLHAAASSARLRAQLPAS